MVAEERVNSSERRATEGGETLNEESTLSSANDAPVAFPSTLCMMAATAREVSSGPSDPHARTSVSPMAAVDVLQQRLLLSLYSSARICETESVS